MRERWLALCILIFFTCTSFFVGAQKNTNLDNYEDSLKVIARDILYGENDFIKYDANERFLNTLLIALNEEKSFEYPFDSLISISRLRAPDNTFRIFNWNLPKANGTYEYFGVIQTHKLGKAKHEVFVLLDKSDEIENPETQILSHDKWYGAHYFEIIKNTAGQKRYYTILGWDGNNSASSKKIIEVLSFKSSGKPVFGAYLFRRYKKKARRVILEYSSTVMVSLKYDDQAFYIRKKSKKRKKNIKRINERMLVFDRLVPMDPNLEGQYEFYVPETNIFDGFVFYNGKWVFIKEVDARNPEDKSRKKQFRKPEYDLFPPKDKPDDKSVKNSKKDP